MSVRAKRGRRASRHRADKRRSLISAAGLLALALASTPAAAQADAQKVAVKSGESVEIENVYWTVNCQSTMVGLPEVEIVQGPPGVSLSISEKPVLPDRAKCPAKVPGGTLMLTATGVSAPIEAKVTYRVKYKTLDGDRQLANILMLSLQP